MDSPRAYISVCMSSGIFLYAITQTNTKFACVNRSPAERAFPVSFPSFTVSFLSFTAVKNWPVHGVARADLCQFTSVLGRSYTYRFSPLDRLRSGENLQQICFNTAGRVQGNLFLLWPGQLHPHQGTITESTSIIKASRIVPTR